MKCMCKLHTQEDLNLNSGRGLVGEDDVAEGGGCVHGDGGG